MSLAANLGFPRIGARRELKFALEQYWAGTLELPALLEQASALRARHWRLQQGLGISHIPSNDFSLYDHVLDAACMFGLIPEGYGWQGGAVTPETYFALARGTATLPALEMTKWFDTNYHYLVPRLAAGQRMELTENRPLMAFREAQALGLRTRPVLLGPVSLLLLSKSADDSDPLDLLDRLLPLYGRVLAELAEAGVAWVQIDEPVLVLDLPAKARAALVRTYTALARGPSPLRLLASYFGTLDDLLPTVTALPIDGLHLDLVRGSAQLQTVAAAPPEMWLSLGVVDGRNIWRTDLRGTLARLRPLAKARGTQRLMLAPSCSLLHVPMDVRQETALDPELAGWLAFATQKLEEVAVLARGLEEGEKAIAADLAACDKAMHARRVSPRVHDAVVAARLATITPAMERRASPFPQRRLGQQARLGLPAFPTTTIGSFPQTAAVRQARAGRNRGDLSAEAYDQAIAGWIDDAIAWQEAAGLDVLVHGEFERNDMVQYFGEQLAGFAFTKHGWVQSYGSRCVAPPIIWCDISRPAPMTLRWTAHAQARTSKPMKGMLTGPVTLLQWSFPRDDVPRETMCRQLALAIRDEVTDLEAAGIAVIQIDEPAFREGLPLRPRDWPAYLRWASACFRLSCCGVRDDTQIHTHMCYSEFADIMPSIAAMDADVISIETTRSQMDLLDAFAGGAYPNEIGPGIWDIHSPRTPDTAEMTALLHRARERLEDWQIWVNPDCGLKTRRWEEVRPAIASLVEAARTLRGGR